MRRPMVVCTCLALLWSAGCGDEPTSTTLEATLSQAIRAEIEFPFAEPEAVLRDEQPDVRVTHLPVGRPLNLAVISDQLGVRVDSLGEDQRVSPPVPAYLAIGEPVEQTDGSTVVSVRYVSLGPPEGEMFVTIVWEVTLRKTAGEWSYDRVIEAMHS